MVYVSKFDVRSGTPEFLEAKTFEDYALALDYLRLLDLESGIEYTIGCGEGNEDWFPPQEN